jgi:ABC-type sulfate transport system substrate-binding protein
LFGTQASLTSVLSRFKTCHGGRHVCNQNDPPHSPGHRGIDRCRRERRRRLPAELLNVSYDPTRELYADYNVAFAKHWKEKSGEDVTIKQSHCWSAKQARAVIDGLDAMLLISWENETYFASKELGPDKLEKSCSSHSSGDPHSA